MKSKNPTTLVHDENAYLLIGPLNDLKASEKQLKKHLSELCFDPFCLSPTVYQYVKDKYSSSEFETLLQHILSSYCRVLPSSSVPNMMKFIVILDFALLYLRTRFQLIVIMMGLT